MKEEKKLEEYCKKMLLDFEIEDGDLFVGEELWKIVNGDSLLFDEDMKFLPATPLYGDMAGYVYEFGGRWYLQRAGEDVDLNELRYIGRATPKIKTEAFLGVRSGYELMNGIGLYRDWVKKAKFLGVRALAICERNTLAGALVFQNECEAEEIKSIFGMTIPVQGTEVSDAKLYVKNFQGWLNLLKFNHMINVEKFASIEKGFLEENREGLFIVIDPKSTLYEDSITLADYYQLDTVTFTNQEKDEWYIDNLEKFIKSPIKPISITDAFYLEQADHITREILHTVGKAFDEKTDNQYFKSKEQYATELIEMFSPKDKSWVSLFKAAVANEAELVGQCNFRYDTNTRHLPKYKMSSSEKIKFETNEELFLHLLIKGFESKKFDKPQQYINRLKEEIRVLRKGDVIDYFLVLYDIIQYAKSENMLTGIGRGSAGGSLVAWLLDITQVNPLEFDLLFERFLNDGRMGFMDQCKAFQINGDVILNEGSIVKIIRDDKERIIFVEDLKEGDNILKY